MQSKKIILAGALALGLAFAPSLKADVQARVNVLAHALSAQGVQVQTLAVGGFIDASSGKRPPFSATLEADLRLALTRYNKNWTVLGAADDVSGADALLTGSFQRSGADINVQVELRAQPGGAVLWQRSAILDGSDVDVADLPPAVVVDEAGMGDDTGPMADGASGEDQVVPTMPWRSRHVRGYYGCSVDFSVGYEAFLPTNGYFRAAAGDLQNGVSLGMAFNDVFLWDVAFWNQNVSDLGSATSLNYAGTDLALVYPFHLGQHFTLYIGPGGRFGEITVEDPALWRDGVDFGNNALTGVVGAKFTADHVGLDLRYTGDLVSSYTGYNTIRLGAFYEFGR
jgi:hypothetical protein